MAPEVQHQRLSSVPWPHACVQTIAEAHTDKHICTRAHKHTQYKGCIYILYFRSSQKWNLLSCSLHACVCVCVCVCLHTELHHLYLMRLLYVSLRLGLVSNLGFTFDIPKMSRFMCQENILRWKNTASSPEVRSLQVQVTANVVLPPKHRLHWAQDSHWCSSHYGQEVAFKLHAYIYFL